MSKRQKTVGISLALIAIIGILVIAIGVSPGWNLTWNVEEGDTLSFDVKAAFPKAILNNTVIVGNISTLPSISSILTPSTFASSILEINKISVSFENGTDTGQYSSFLNTIISLAILPCGEWEVLDAMYPDPDSVSISPSGKPGTYVTKLEEAFFSIGYVHPGIDSSSGWNANVSLDTGIPYYIQTWRYDVQSPPTGRLVYQVVLELFFN